jgi:hypothetical protein
MLANLRSLVGSFSLSLEKLRISSIKNMIGFGLVVGWCGSLLTERVLCCAVNAGEGEIEKGSEKEIGGLHSVFLLRARKSGTVLVKLGLRSVCPWRARWGLDLEQIFFFFSHRCLWSKDTEEKREKKKKKRMDFFTALPDDMLLEIFKRIPESDWFSVLTCCRKFAAVAKRRFNPSTQSTLGHLKSSLRHSNFTDLAMDHWAMVSTSSFETSVFDLDLSVEQELVACTISIHQKIALYSLQGSLVREFCPEQVDDPFGIKFYSPEMLVVSDWTKGTVNLVNITGKHVKSFGNPTQKFCFPGSIAINRAKDKLLIADAKNKRIQLLDVQTETLSVLLSDPSLKFPMYVTYDSLHQRVVVSARDSNLISLFDWNGNFISSFGATVLRSPMGVALTKEGNFVVANKQMDKLSFFDDQGRHLHESDEIPEGKYFPNAFLVCLFGEMVLTHVCPLWGKKPLQ